MAAAINKLASDRGLLARRKQAAYQRAQEFSWRRVAEQTAAMYHDALNAKRLNAQR